MSYCTQNKDGKLIDIKQKFKSFVLGVYCLYLIKKQRRNVIFGVDTTKNARGQSENITDIDS